MDIIKNLIEGLTGAFQIIWLATKETAKGIKEIIINLFKN